MDKTTNKIIAIPDLDRKIEETLFDAVNHFDKKCPYCGTNLYDGHIRDKIETDHYIPISLGGQHVPWNVLPSCKKCNRKKKNIHPHIYMNVDVRNKCESFLDDVRTRLTDSIQKDIDAAQQARLYIKDKLQSVSSYETKNMLLELSKIFHVNIGVDCPASAFSSCEHSIRRFVESECDLGIHYSISKEGIYQKYIEYCSVNKMHAQAKPLFFKSLFALTKEVSSFRPNIKGNRQWWLRGIAVKS